MQLPTIEAFKKTYPDSHITVWVAPRGTKALAQAHPAIDTVIESPIRGTIITHLATYYLLLATKSTTAVVLYPGQHWKSAGHLWLAGIPQRIGHQYPFRGNPASGWLLNNPVEIGPELHDIEQNMRLLEPLGSKQQVASSTHYSFAVPHQKQQSADDLFRRYVPSEQQLTVGFHLGSAPDLLAKRWPLERFVETGKRLIEQHNAHILLFGGPEEAELKQEAKRALGRRASIVDAELLVVAGVVKHCNVFLSNDSGLLHLAAAVRTTTYGLFGPTDEQRTGARGIDSHVIRAPDTKPVFDVNANFDLGTQPHETMLAITPQMVIDKIT